MSPEAEQELDALKVQVAVLNKKLSMVLERTGMKDLEIDNMELRELTEQCILAGDFKLKAVKAFLREKNARKTVAAA